MTYEERKRGSQWVQNMRKLIKTMDREPKRRSLKQIQLENQILELSKQGYSYGVIADMLCIDVNKVGYVVRKRKMPLCQR